MFTTINFLFVRYNSCLAQKIFPDTKCPDFDGNMQSNQEIFSRKELTLLIGTQPWIGSGVVQMNSIQDSINSWQLKYNLQVGVYLSTTNKILDKNDYNSRFDLNGKYLKNKASNLINEITDT
ncbi:hypothetical protein [Salmonirosea aquatica]|uniref:Uncharacterized protein n=1 Tax=Salmonirosea aquatica TaxID=2654236 RepID=A0A7C9BPZ9_9BACT|nr:hypothetical protein [Cytophagaceae bacterium SJW1-29]